MKASDFQLFKQCMTRDLGIHFMIQDSEVFDGQKHERLEFYDRQAFEAFYPHLLNFCVDNDGYVLATSIKNMSVTVLLEVDY